MTTIPVLGFLLMLAGQVTPTRLIDGLSSSSPEVRSQAIDALEAQGLSSLPSLRSLASSGTGEAADLAARLVERIGSSRLRRATPTPLTISSRTVLDARRELARPMGVEVNLWIDPDSRWRFDKVSLDAKPARHFFASLDALGAAHGFRAGVESPVGDPVNPRPRFTLVERSGAMPPTSYVGPYRVSLVQISRHRSVKDQTPPGNPDVVEDFHAILETSAEPGVTIQPNGPPRLVEVVDEKGQDLRSGHVAQPGSTESLSLADRTDQVAMILSRVNLALPTDPGKTITLMKGFVPIVAMCRTAELFSIDLQPPGPRSTSGGGVTMTIERASLDGAVKQLDVTIVGEVPPSATQFAAGPRQTTQAILRLPYNLADHLVVEDAAGQDLAVTCVPSAPPSRDGSMSYRIQIPARAPHRLRYYGVAGIAAELPFVFRNLPIP